jgi:hypothetical protein
MLEEALPLAVGVGVALLPCLAFGGLSAFRAFAILGGGECAGGRDELGVALPSLCTSAMLALRFRRGIGCLTSSSSPRGGLVQQEQQVAAAWKAGIAVRKQGRLTRRG